MNTVAAGTVESSSNLAAYTPWPTTTLTYQFYTALPTYYESKSVPYLDSTTNSFLTWASVFNPAGLNATEQAAALTVFQKVSALTPLTFSLAAPGNDSNLGFGTVLPDYRPVGAAAWASEGTQPVRDSDVGDIWLSESTGGRIIAQPGGGVNSYGYSAIMHEVGHALGLKHTQDSGGGKPALTGQENSSSFSVMSYSPTINENRHVFDFQLYDIASLQSLYGRNDDYRSGSDTFGWFDFVEVDPNQIGPVRNRYWSIWDGGGDDRISAKADEPMTHLAGAAFIDLRPGHFSSIGRDTGVTVSNNQLLATGIQNVSIAFGSYIENATGTDFSDAIVGNNFSNEIFGEAGNDLILGSGAAVALANARAGELGLSAATGTGINDATDGDYSRIQKGGVQANSVDASISVDELHGGDGNDIIVAGAGNNKLWGDAGNDRMMGGEGNDEFDGGSGDDILWGNGGVDTAQYSNNDKPITITYTGLTGSAGLKVVDSNRGTDTLFGIEKVIATASRDTLNVIGSIARDTQLIIDANGGQGSSPQDTINATKATAVSIVIDAASGSGYIESQQTGGKIGLLGFHTGIIGSGFNDTISDLSSGHKQIDGGLGNDTITAAGSSATLYGGAGDDIITGGNGNDVLIGGAGVDHLHGGNGSDWLVGSGDGQNVEVLEGGDGADKFTLNHSNGLVTMIGGAGNDVYDLSLTGTTQYVNTVIKLSAGDGHDVIVGPTTMSGNANGWTSVAVTPPVAKIDLTDFSINDFKIVWDASVVQTKEDNDPLYNISQLFGGMALVSKSGSESIFLGMLSGFTYPNFDYENYNFSFSVPIVNFSDGFLNFNNDGIPSLTLEFGSVSAYMTAENDYASATATDVVNLVGGSGNDTLFGSSANENLTGGAGDDSFDASGGIDHVDGGLGIDTLNLFSSGLDFSLGLAANGSIVISDLRDGSVTTLTSVERLYLSHDDFSAPVVNQGTTGDDVLSGAFILLGLDGNDEITGSEFNDYIDGGDGNDVILGGAGADVLTGGLGNDTLFGGEGDDLLEAAFGANILNGGSGNDLYRVDLSNSDASISDYNRPEPAYLNAPSASDVNALAIEGVSASDLMLSRQGDRYQDLVISANGHSIVLANQFGSGIARETILSLYVEDAVGKTDLTQMLGGSQFLHATAGDDQQIGTQYGDLISSSTGNDVMIGLDGADTYEIGSGGNDLIDDRGIGTDKAIVPEWKGPPGSAPPRVSEDTVSFAFWISADDVTLERSGNDLLIHIDGVSGVTTIKDQFLAEESFGDIAPSDWSKYNIDASHPLSISGIEKFVFSDGTTWDRDDVIDLTADTTYARSSANETKSDDSIDIYNMMVHEYGNFKGYVFTSELNPTERDWYMDEKQHYFSNVSSNESMRFEEPDGANFGAQHYGFRSLNDSHVDEGSFVSLDVGHHIFDSLHLA